MVQLFYAYLGAVLLHRGFDILHDFVRRLLFHVDTTLYSTLRPLNPATYGQTRDSEIEVKPEEGGSYISARVGDTC